MNKALTLGVISVAITAGTYFVLHSIAPQRHVEEKREQQGPTVEEVFASELNLSALDSAAETATDAPAQATPAGDTAAADEAAPVDASAEPVADEASLDASAADAGNGDMGAVDVAAAPAAEPAAVEPPPAAEPPPAVEPEPAPAPAPVAEAPKPKAEAPKAAAKPAEKKAAPAKAISPWWGTESPNELSLVYAGSAAYKKAVVLMFNGSFDNADSADKNIKVKDAAGNTVSGKWELGASNKKMLVFPVAKNGRYTVTVGNGVTDRNNRALGKKLSGAVQVQ